MHVRFTPDASQAQHDSSYNSGNIEVSHSRRVGHHGSACSPVTAPVFKTGGWQVFLSPVRSTRTRFRQNKGFSSACNPFAIR